MSLYADYEICDGCIHATFHSCNRCLKECKIDKLSEVDRCSGRCKHKEK